MNKGGEHMIEKIVKFITNKLSNSNKKELINALVSIVVVLVLLMFLYNTVFSQNIGEKRIDLIDDATDKTLHEDLSFDDEERLEKILSQIRGVGRVDVMITYETGKEIIPAFDIQEKSQNKESREADGSITFDSSEDSSKNLVTVNNEDLLVLKEIKPKVKGIIIVAEGAGNLVIRNDIMNAAAAVFDISTDKIVVFEKNQSLEGSVMNE